MVVWGKVLEMNEKQEMRKGGWKRVGGAVLILLLLAAGAGAYWHFYMRGTVSTDDARLSGQLLDLSSQISGILTNVLVSEGDPVKKDQLLFTLDKRSLEASLERAKALVASERVALAMAETQYEKLSRGVRAEEIEMAGAAERRAAAQARLAALSQTVDDGKKPAFTIRQILTDVADSFASSPDGKYLLFQDANSGNLAIHDLETGRNERNGFKRGDFNQPQRPNQVCQRRWVSIQPAHLSENHFL